MSHLISLKRTEGDRKVEGSAYAEGDKGEPQIHLDQHHLKKLGLDGPLQHGHEIRIRARGVVSGSHSSDTEQGKQHSMRVKLTHATLKHDEEDSHEDLKGDIEASYAKSSGQK